MNRILCRTYAMALAAVLAFLPLTARAQDAAVTVFAASSLTDALQAIAKDYQARTGVKIVLSFGASSTLAHQIDQGAKADLFMSADTDWMDFLQKNGRLAAGTRKDLLGNRLVLIAGADDKADIRIAPHFDLAGALKGGRLALADPTSVPAGKYGKEALTRLGVWDSIAGAIAPAENVRVALEYVDRGEAPLGIVYASDAKTDPRVRVVGTFPDDSHAPIVYPVAQLSPASAAAGDFEKFLSAPSSRAVLEKDGFTMLGG